MYVEVVTEVLKGKYDLVIKQSENPSWMRSVFGCNDIDLLRNCPSSVWLIHENTSENYKAVVAAIDFSNDSDEIESEHNSRIAYQAAAFSLCNNAKMHVLSAYNSENSGYASNYVSDPEKFELEHLFEEERQRKFSATYLINEIKKSIDGPNIHKLSISQHISKGHAITTILEKVKELTVDLVVMGTEGRSGLMGMLVGNTAESVLLQLECSVLVLKPKDFKCPISL